MTTPWYYDYYEKGSFPHQEQLCKAAEWIPGCNLEGRMLKRQNVLSATPGNPLTIRLRAIDKSLEYFKDFKTTVKNIKKLQEEQLNEHGFSGISGKWEAENSLSSTGGSPRETIEIAGKRFIINYVDIQLALYEFFTNFGSVIDRLAYEIDKLYELDIPKRYLGWGKLTLEPELDKLSIKNESLAKLLGEYRNKFCTATRYRNRLTHDGIIHFERAHSELEYVINLREDPDDDNSIFNVDAIKFCENKRNEILTLLNKSYELILNHIKIQGGPPWRKQEAQMPQAKVAVIGGTGLYDIEGMTDIQQVDIDTPFGKPSDSITTGRLEGVGVAFLPRHGKGHHLSPAEVPSRANIYALKSLGVEHIIAICSSGSFREEIKPGDLLIPDQIIDRTNKRISSFFDGGIVAHIPFAEPFCPTLRQILYRTAGEVGANKVHPKGTYLAMEGPAFSTRAESQLYRSWGADIIGMTALPEAKLAREAEICYAVVACVSDYDSWHEHKGPVNIDVVLDIMRHSSAIAKKIIKLAVARMPKERDCECATALKTAIVTNPELIPAEQKKKLDLLIGKYL